MQYYQTQQSLAVLSADFSDDRSWSMSHTKEHNLALVFTGTQRFKYCSCSCYVPNFALLFLLCPKLCITDRVIPFSPLLDRWKVMKDGNAICVIDGVLNTPIFECLSLLNESDLHKNWIPFLSVSFWCQSLRPLKQLI